MFALLLTPLTIASLMLSTEVRTDVRANNFADTVPAGPTAIDTSIPILNLDIVKRLGAVKKELELLAKKHPELGGGAIGIALQSKSYSRFENSKEFAELAQKHGFTVKQFFATYSEVAGGLFILNVEKQLNQSNLTEAQGFKALPMNKRFLEKNKVLIKELKLDESYVGPKPPPPNRRRNPFSSMNPMGSENSMEPENPMDRDQPRNRDNPTDPTGGAYVSL